MNWSAFPLVAGMVTAMWHVWSGPDHLAAVTPLVLQRRRRFAPVGIAWGVGHTIGMMLIGGLYLLLQSYLPVDRISAHSEQLVGLTLVGVGAVAVFRGRRGWMHHAHPHAHQDGDEVYVHVHRHHHTLSEGHRHEHAHREPQRQGVLTALGIGILHGFGGIAHLLLLLPTLGFSHTWQSAAYLGGFFGGAIAAMGSYAAVVGRMGARIEQRMPRARFVLQIGSGLAAVLIGIYWMAAGA